jgi:hypothetical protein
MRNPQEIVMAIAYTIKEGRKGDVYTVSDISKRTEMHYMTVNDYIGLIEFVQTNVPIIKRVNQRGKSRIVISKELEMDLSEKERMLLNLFDSGAFTSETAVTLRSFGKEHVSSAAEDGHIIEIDNKFYLTTNGIVTAAEYAGKRAESVTSVDEALMSPAPSANALN